MEILVGCPRLVAACATILLVTATWTISGADAQTLPSKWTVTDIGRPPSPGVATFASPTFTVMSRGLDVNGVADQFTFAYRWIRGDFAIKARLKTLPNVDAWAQAGLMIRASLRADARHAFVFGAPGKVVWRTRPTWGGGTYQASGGPTTIPVWLKLERRSSTLTAFRSNDGRSWTKVRTLTLQLPSDLLVGLAVASHTRTRGLWATFDSVTVSSLSTRPAVSLTSPANGSSYTSPAPVALGATATDPDGIAKVDFYAGTTRIGTDTTSPYAVKWTAGAGTYTLKAVATDKKGASATSATRRITVFPPTTANVAPHVSMTWPLDGASFVAGASVTFAATASDTNGTIQSVRFYLGTKLIATDTTSPYLTRWPAVVGSHSVTAVATDNQGAVTVASWRDFIVTETALPARAIFKPASPAHEVDYYVFEVFAAGANPKVAAPIARQNIGLPRVVDGECSADVRATIVGLAPGNYKAIVAAVTSDGKLRSNAFSFTR